MFELSPYFLTSWYAEKPFLHKPKQQVRSSKAYGVRGGPDWVYRTVITPV